MVERETIAREFNAIYGRKHFYTVKPCLTDTSEWRNFSRQPTTNFLQSEYDVVKTLNTGLRRIVVKMSAAICFFSGDHHTAHTLVPNSTTAAGLSCTELITE